MRATHERRADGQLIVVLENDRVRLEALPELGAKVWSLIDRRRGVDWIWRNPNLALGAIAPGASYDDSWVGGWEQLFPNDAPERFDGRSLPDHGEWWTRSWDWTFEQHGENARSLHLSLDSDVMPVRCDKWLALSPDAPGVTSRYRVENRGPETLRFLLKEHLAVAIGAHHELHLPGGVVTPVDRSFSTRIGPGGPFQWPYATGAHGQALDLRQLPGADSGQREFIYVTDLPAGWCEVRDVSTGAALHMSYPQDVFPSAWFFMTFGGWRNLHTIVLEPCTNVPKLLAMAASGGRCASLEAGQSLDCTVTVTLS